MAKQAKHNSAFKTYFTFWVILLVAVYFGLRNYIDNIWLLLFAIANIVSFLLFGIDKFQARIAGRRVPEKMLYLASFLGGPIGAVAAMKFFRHKTQKEKFQIILAVLILVQIGIAAYILS